MQVAKIIRHRHKFYHYLNKDLKDVREETHFKIIFSDPVEFKKFGDWCLENEGIYDYDKEKSCQNGKLPKMDIFKDEICWCDIMIYYLVHVARYNFYDTISPYKGEIYTREENAQLFNPDGNFKMLPNQ